MILKRLLSNQYLQIPFFLYLPILLTLIIYWPGLGGPFLFDDEVNFQSLMQLGGHTAFERVYYFILTGNAGPLGRPISLLSFMLNDNAWPSNPWSFKYTNLMIHCLTGVLIFIFSTQVSRYLKISAERKYFFAGVITTIWLLHPMQTSTVLYVIQRMTQLSTLFTLAGLSCYLQGRQSLADHKNTITAYINMSLGIILFGLFATFSKESGILIIFFVAVIEYCLLDRSMMPASYRYWRHLFITLPVLVVFSALLYKLPAFNAGYAIRSFTMTERLLSEARVLCDYLYQIVVPKIGGTGLFHDDFVPSKGLLTPPSTLFSVFTISILVYAGFYLRKRKPFISFGILWFFSAHILESTFIPLELYFEHRNYLAILGPIFLFVTPLFQRNRYAHYLQPALVVFITAICFLTFQNVRTWSNHIVAARVWASENPRSIRAAQSASAIEVMLGHNQKAREYIANVARLYPDEVALQLQLVQLDCNTGTLTEPQLEALTPVLRTGKYSNATIPTIINLYMQTSHNTCKVLTPDRMIQIIDTLTRNPAFTARSVLHALYYWRGQLYAEKRMLEPAMVSLNLANQYMGVIDIPLQQAIWLSSAGLYNAALEYVDKAEAMDNRARNPLLLHARQKDIVNLRRLIERARDASKGK